MAVYRRGYAGNHAISCTPTPNNDAASQCPKACEVRILEFLGDKPIRINNRTFINLKAYHTDFGGILSRGIEGALAILQTPLDVLPAIISTITRNLTLRTTLGLFL
jgi:hypothetical protein